MRFLPCLAVLVALTACDSVRTIASASPANKLHAANALYEATAKRAAAYGRECQAKPDLVCHDAVLKSQKVDVVAYSALSEANRAWKAGDTGNVDLLIGAAEGSVNGLAALYE